jgi:ribokinase
MPDVVTLGDINVDLIARVLFYPSPGGDSLAEGVDVRAGGSAANTAVVLSKFGLEVSILGRVGDDLLAQQTLPALEQVGVDLSLVQRDPETKTGLVFSAVTPDGEHTFFSCRGANTKTVLRSGDLDQIRGAKVLHVSGYALVESPQRDTALQAMEEAHKSGVPVSLDLGIEVTTTDRDETVEMLALVSMVFPNRSVAQWVTGEAGSQESVEALLSLGPELVGLKMRDQGCLLGAPDEIFHVPAFKVDPVDDTGAGDSCDAGLILGRTGVLSLRESGLLANALGALATMVTGAGDGLPGPREALSFLEERRKDGEWRDWTEELSGVCDYLRRMA